MYVCVCVCVFVFLCMFRGCKIGQHSIYKNIAYKPKCHRGKSILHMFRRSQYIMGLNILNFQKILKIFH